MANAFEHAGKGAGGKGKIVLIGILLGALFTVAYIVIDGPSIKSIEEEVASSPMTYQPAEPKPKKPFEGELQLFTEDAITVKPGTEYEQKIMLNVDGKTNNLIQGSFVESAGYGITFYVFDQKNYQAFKAGGRYTPYTSAKRVKSYEFSFTPDHSGLYYFIFDNNYSVSTEKTPILSVTWTWQEGVLEE